MEFNHKPVLLNECIEALNIRSNGFYIDGTLGGGGHSFSICEKLDVNGRLVGIDRDTDAIAKSSSVLLPFFDNVILVNDNFSNLKSILAELNISNRVDGILLDLGVSSFQLDNAERGFSYMHDAPLDMRMDISSELTAFDVVNNYTQDQLCKLIFDYGEERWGSRIAQFIVTERKNASIVSTFELVSVIKKAIPKSARIDGPHPAKRTFQAIRIEVNQELSILNDSIFDMSDILSPGGRLCIISFHSLEDRIVKNCFRSLESCCTCPPQFPVCVCGKESVGKVISRKPITPSQIELSDNPRSRSAKLRVFEKNT